MQPMLGVVVVRVKLISFFAATRVLVNMQNKLLGYNSISFLKQMDCKVLFHLFSYLPTQLIHRGLTFRREELLCLQ
jgi:hypothetical protein